MIDAVEDLKALRETYAGDRIPDFDKTLGRLLQCVVWLFSEIFLVTQALLSRQLAIICVACQSLVPTQEKGILKKTSRRAKNLYYSNTVKRKITLLDERVHRAHQRFTVCQCLSNCATFLLTSAIDYECRAYLNQDRWTTRSESSFLHFKRCGMTLPRATK